MDRGREGGREGGRKGGREVTMAKPGNQLVDVCGGPTPCTRM